MRKRGAVLKVVNGFLILGYRGIPTSGVRGVAQSRWLAGLLRHVAPEGVLGANVALVKQDAS